MSLLQREDISLINEEEQYFLQLQKNVQKQTNNDPQYQLLNQILELRNSINEVNDDDIPQLIEQIERLSKIINNKGTINSARLNLDQPYFAHMKIKERGKIKDFFIGESLFRSSDGGIQIVDWRRSPVSVLYYRCENGEEYEEEVGEHVFEGIMLFKRAISFSEGKIIAIRQNEKIYNKDHAGKWHKNEQKIFTLAGGSKSAMRPETYKNERPQLGTARKGTSHQDKFLPQITSLLDQEQHALITSPDSGVVVVQGGAGSGKTTVGLHRMAWLYYRDAQRFAPQSISVVVYGKALATYIGKALPALGVHGVKVNMYRSMLQELKKRLLGHVMPKNYNDTTPVSVIRLKKHPLLFEYIKICIMRKEAGFQVSWKSALEECSFKNMPHDFFQSMPLVRRWMSLKEWLLGKFKGNIPPFNGGTEQQIILIKCLSGYFDLESNLLNVFVGFWSDIFSNFKDLRDYFNKTGGFSTAEMQEIDSWLKKQYIELTSFFEKELPTSREARLDEEDDAILLYLYREIINPLPQKNKKRIRFSHLFIDETQDLSVFELEILLGFLSKPRSLTLAGDFNQRYIEYTGVSNWNELLGYVGLEKFTTASLSVSYRSTRQIMEFSLTVLGDLEQKKTLYAQKEGTEVEVFQAQNQGVAVYFLSEQLKKLLINEPKASVAVICPTGSDAKECFLLLQKYEVPYSRLVLEQDFLFMAGIDVTEVLQIKGLEFDYVILMDVDLKNYPDTPRFRYLLHVASTRASHQLWIVNYRYPSRILPLNFLEMTRKI